MKIVSITASYQRLSITTDTLNLLKQQDHLVARLLVGSDPDTQKAAELTGADLVLHKNSPLGGKWQAGLEMARQYDPDAILICGSDDWLTHNWCKIGAKQIEAGFDLVGKGIWCVCHAIPGHPLKVFRVQYVRRKDPIGSGRLISRRVLERLNWKLFPRNKERYLDWAACNNIRGANGRLQLFNEHEDAWLLCIKSTWPTKSQWVNKPFSAGCRWGEVSHAREWVGGHFPGAPIDKYWRTDV